MGYTMTFLFSWLYLAGPRPIKSKNRNRLHRWDFVALFWIPLRRLCGKHDDYDEVHTDEKRQHQPPTDVINLPPKFLAKGDSNDDYSIEILEDADDDNDIEGNVAAPVIEIVPDINIDRC